MKKKNLKTCLNEAQSKLDYAETCITEAHSLVDKKDRNEIEDVMKRLENASNSISNIKN
ncbi:MULTISPECIES: hypothetical protein [Clostridium]|uniref:hypothetical protein n=1 Tax=Clostridium TaxID=1485 RepID=UPI000311B22C|nr:MULTISPECIES: hypothetical protein [Clostridium]